jgi:hypothetical protein
MIRCHSDYYTDLNKLKKRNMVKYFKLLQQTIHLLRQNSVSCTYWAGPDMPGCIIWYSADGYESCSVCSIGRSEQVSCGHKVYDKCKKISKLKCDASTKQKDYDNDNDSDEIEQFAKITAVQSLNKSLQPIGESPIKKKRLCEGMYPTSKIKKLKTL